MGDYLVALGAVDINNGSIQIGANDSLSNRENIRIGPSGTLDLNGFDDKVNDVMPLGDFVWVATDNGIVRLDRFGLLQPPPGRSELARRP